MIDTLAIMTELDYDLDLSLFDGASITENIDGETVSWRVYRNGDDADEYTPRVNYRPISRWFKIEFSLMKIANESNLDYVEMGNALQIVSGWVAQEFDIRVPIGEWIVQRIDYTWDFVVDKPDAYVGFLSKLRMGGFTSHPQKHGMYWKSGSRWVKFYCKDENTLRYEVSNFYNGVKYMCSRWFGCARTVSELVHCGRALYIMSLFWDKLGLFTADLGNDVAQVMALRGVFNQRVSQAYYALMCISVYGVESYKSLDLISSSSYYSWKSELKAKGFIYFDVDDDDVELVTFKLGVLSLPVEFVVEQARQNLKVFSTAGAPSLSKNFSEIRRLLGVSDSVALSENLAEVFKHAYA